MTREELSRLNDINRKIMIDKGRLEELRAVAEKTTTTISGLPHVHMDPHASETVRIALAEQEELVRLQIRQSIIEYNRLTRWLSEIEDPMIYDILYLRYVSGMTWRQVAFSVGGGNTEEGVRKTAARYIEDNCKN